MTPRLGANPSAEDQEEALEDGAQTVNDVVHSFRLQSTSFDKKSFLTYLKVRARPLSLAPTDHSLSQGYMKAVKAELQKSNPDRVEAFEKGAQAFAKKVVGNFKDWEFYTGESMNPDGMVALLNYREDGSTRAFSPFAPSAAFSCTLAAYLVFWKDGLKEVKL